MKRSILKANAVVCVSKNTRNDLMKMIPNLDSSKVHVIHNGKSDDYKFLNEISEEKCILYVGNRKGYKNFKSVVKALEITNNYRIIIVGGGRLKTNEKKLLSKIGHNRYMHYPYTTNEELNILYNKAFCLVYPSVYEGFGIPVLEAQAAGCPVIALDRSTMPEILKNSGLLLKDGNPETIANAIISLEDKSLRKQYQELGFINSNKYNWKTMSDKYYQLYHELWKNN